MRNLLAKALRDKYENIKSKVGSFRVNRPRMRKREEEVPLPNTDFKRISLQESSFLKLFRQKNAAHVGDRENAFSVMTNFNYDIAGKQRYIFGASFEEPDLKVDEKLLI